MQSTQDASGDASSRSARTCVSVWVFAFSLPNVISLFEIFRPIDFGHLITATPTRIAGGAHMSNDLAWYAVDTMGMISLDLVDDIVDVLEAETDLRVVECQTRFDGDAFGDVHSADDSSNISVESGEGTLTYFDDMMPSSLQDCLESVAGDCDAPHARAQWSEEEDEHLSRMAQTLGYKWRTIAKCMPGRTEDSVRQRYGRLVSSGKTERLSYQKAKGGVTAGKAIGMRRAWSQHEDNILCTAIENLDLDAFKHLCEMKGSFQAVRNRKGRLMQQGRLTDDIEAMWRQLLTQQRDSRRA